MVLSRGRESEFSCISVIVGHYFEHPNFESFDHHLKTKGLSLAKLLAISLDGKLSK